VYGWCDSTGTVASVGVVLGGGGVIGQAFHVGVLAALAESGFDPRSADLLVGTSAGSQISALLRAGVPAADLAASAMRETLSAEGARLLAPLRAAGGIPEPGARAPGLQAAPRLLARLATRPWEARLGVVLAAALPAGRRSTAWFVSGLDPLFGRDWPEAGLFITAVRLDTGRRVAFGAHGAPPASVGEAVAASCAIPGFFTPVEIGGVRYVDGGCHTPTNLDLVAGLGLDVVVVSSPMSLDGRPRRPSPARALHSAEVAWEAYQVRRRGSRVVVFQPDAALAATMGWNSLEYRRVPAVAAASHELALRRLARGALDTVRR
jgi:NTE family protein